MTIMVTLSNVERLRRLLRSLLRFMVNPPWWFGQPILAC